jgi:hypothetical protein
VQSGQLLQKTKTMPAAMQENNCRNGSSGSLRHYVLSETFRKHLETAMQESIRKVDGSWAVYPKGGGKRLGTHPTKKAALKQLAAIEISKLQNRSK